MDEAADTDAAAFILFVVAGSDWFSQAQDQRLLTGSRCRTGEPAGAASTALGAGPNHWAGIVISGSFSAPPVSASVKKNITAVRARFVAQSLSSTQNQ